MSEYKELIRQFDKIRSYVRDFYVYGFKTREDFHEKSGRTYDNQRRRMESWFSGYIQTDQNGHKKSVFLTMDSSRMAVNPLYQAWKSKAFTDNDISLRFLLADLLADGRPRSLETIANELQLQYGCLLDTQAIRRKLAFYEKEGLIACQKEGRQYQYSSISPLAQTHPGLFPALWLAVSFFQGAAPFGFIGSTILDFWNRKNEIFRFRSDYLIHTLEDEILLPILRAMEQKRRIRITVKSTKCAAAPSFASHREHPVPAKCSPALGIPGPLPGRAGSMDVTPLKILSSTHTGRRYLCAWHEKAHRLSTFRLDSIQNTELLTPDPLYDTHMKCFQDIFPHVWGVSFGESPKTRLETVTMEICFDEKEEGFILTRLEREGRGGSLKRLTPGVYEYTRLCVDAAELLPWAKSFTGRIRAFRCSNPAVEKRFWNDMKKMQEYYGMPHQSS